MEVHVAVRAAEQLRGRPAPAARSEHDEVVAPILDLVTHLILLDAVGIDVPGHGVTDVSTMTVPQIMQLSFHDPQPFLRDPASLSAEEQAVLAANQAVLPIYAPTMTDHTLASRLAALDLPTLVIWGESDGIVGVEYGRSYAEAIAGARFVVLPNTGHMPQLETPELVVDAIQTELRA